MKSDVIRIDNQGNGYAECVQLTEKCAQYRGLERKETVQLMMIAQEMLSLARSVTGEMEASFWLESEGRAFTLYMTTETVMDKGKRNQLLSAATSRKNEITGSFLGRLRDAFEEAMTAEADHVLYEMPAGVMNDVNWYNAEDPEWDGYERSVLRGLADNVKIAIRGGEVCMTVSKQFEE